MKRIAYIEDDPDMVELVSMILEKHGYQVDGFTESREIMPRLESVKPELILLDLMMPRMDGWEVCRRVRAESNLPILMLTARDQDIDKIVGLEMGADDYLTKPFNPRELVARIKAILRRAEPRRPGEGEVPLRAGNLTIDPARREARVAGRLVDLRAKEFDLLLALVENRGLVLSREKLLDLVWGFDFYGQTRTVDVHVAHLRAKLRGCTAEIETVWGVGYKLSAD